MLKELEAVIALAWSLLKLLLLFVIIETNPCLNLALVDCFSKKSLIFLSFRLFRALLR